MAGQDVDVLPRVLAESGQLRVYLAAGLLLLRRVVHAVPGGRAVRQCGMHPEDDSANRSVLGIVRQHLLNQAICAESNMSVEALSMLMKSTPRWIQ